MLLLLSHKITLPGRLSGSRESTCKGPEAKSYEYCHLGLQGATESKSV